MTHSHGDHLGDAVELAKKSKAKLGSSTEADVRAAVAKDPRLYL